MLKYGDPNPLAIFGLRQMDFLPPHFEVITFDLRVSQKRITDWLYENTDSRFYIGDVVVDGHTKCCVAFEHHAECSFFALHLTELNAVNYQQF